MRGVEGPLWRGVGGPSMRQATVHDSAAEPACRLVLTSVHIIRE